MKDGVIHAKDQTPDHLNQYAELYFALFISRISGSLIRFKICSPLTKKLSERLVEFKQMRRKFQESDSFLWGKSFGKHTDEIATS